MRIQHNIMAMNAYRNYTNNTNALSQNLEKLSSGYKINRAGDDAAGLAISEKMRAQISGLEQAQDNAKSGKNLVNTAEGALQEVHDMLNRMVTLADQSANGTYDNETDRKALQDEVDQLTDEINRIADSANYNGIQLLDGSLAGAGSSGVSADVSIENMSGTLSTANAVSASGEATFTANKVNALKNGTEYSVNITFADANGNPQTQTVTFKAGASSAATQKNFGAALQEAMGSDYTVTYTATSGKVNITANEAGASKFKLYNVTLANADGSEIQSVSASKNTAGTAAYNKLVLASGDTWDGTGELKSITVNGEKFAIIKTASLAAKLDPSINYVVATKGSSAGNSLVALINQKTGINATYASGSKTISFKDNSGGKGGLTLQIGDTSDSFNQLNISIQDMHANSLGISGISVADQKSAQAAVDVIKAAINTVSTVRGNLGAASNRLDHTMNNLSVMTENIQDAESTIRDTDVADEMMAYTKNNILVQSAQAMLAQANQVPQGVLQLLQ